MEELFTIIGKLYTDMVQMQNIISNFQQQLKDKDARVKELEEQLSTKN
jgi:hypothetical protein